MSTGQEQIERVRRLHGDNWADFARRWIAYALRTEPIEPDVIGPYIVELYRAAGFAEPRVVVVSSPGVMAFAGAFSRRYGPGVKRTQHSILLARSQKSRP
jgi:hypothetical protein